MRATLPILVLTFLVFFCQLTYAQKSKQVPKNIDEAVAYIDKHWSKKGKKRFKVLPEREAVARVHFSAGIWIRNHWIHGERDTALTHQLRALGIYHPDDMSSIIMTSFHRKLNNLPFDIEGQVARYKAYWQPIIEYEKQSKQKAVETYNRYFIGDTIKIFMRVDTAQGKRNAVIISSPKYEWTYDPQKDLQMQGIINNKYFVNDTSNVYFSVKILSMNFENTEILMQEVKPNDIYDFRLYNLRIE